MKTWYESVRPDKAEYRRAHSSDTQFEVDFFTLHARPKPADRILVFGCSDMDALTALAGRVSCKITAADQSDYRLDAVARLAREHALDITCVKSEQLHCPLPDQRFDAVAIFGNSLARPNDLNQTTSLLAEVKRLLCPGGALVLSIADGDWRRRYFLPDDVEMLPSGFIYRRSELSADGERLITHEFAASQELGLATERLSVERLLGAEEIFAMLNSCGFESTSFCKRAATQPRQSLFSSVLPPRLYFSGRTGPQRRTPPSLRLVKSGVSEGMIS